jgi:hypothetical protein
VGIVFYGLVRDRVPSRAVAGVAATLHDDESAHLDFLVALLRRLVDGRQGVSRRCVEAQLVATTMLVLAGALCTFGIDHRRTLAALGSNGISFANACIGEIVRRWRAENPVPPARACAAERAA